MAWREWVWGLVSAIAMAGTTIISNMMAMDSCPTGWEAIKMMVLPAALAFLLYIKDHAPKGTK